MLLNLIFEIILKKIIYYKYKKIILLLLIILIKNKKLRVQMMILNKINFNKFEIQMIQIKIKVIQMMNYFTIK